MYVSGYEGSVHDVKRVTDEYAEAATDAGWARMTAASTIATDVLRIITHPTSRKRVSILVVA